MSTLPQTTSDQFVAPSRCPVCRSQDITTTSKVANIDSYWRCCACGEVWNVERNRAGARYSNSSPYRR